jgi:hypothetical protein
VAVARDPSQVSYDLQAKQIKDTADAMASAIPVRPGEVDRRTEWHDEYIANHMRDLTIARYQSMAASIAQDVEQTGDVSKSEAYADAKKTYVGDVEGENWVKGPEWVELGKGLEQGVQEGMSRFNAKDATQRRAEDEAIGTALEQVDSALYKPNGAGGVTIAATPDALAALDRISNMPGAGRHVGEIDALRQVLHTATQDQISGKETTTDRGTYLALTNRIGSTTNPLTKADVDQARASNQLSDTDYHFLRDSASDTKSANPKISHALTELHRWQEQVKPMIDKSNPLLGTPDTAGAQQFSFFAWDTENKIRQAIASGEDPDKAVQRLTDPRNPQGFYHFIPQYQTTMRQSISNLKTLSNPDAVPSAAPVPGGINHVLPPPRLPGESIKDYLKRTDQ